MSSDYATDTQMGGGGNFAGATNVLQRVWNKRKSGRKLRRNARNAHRLLQASMTYCVQRWQRVYAYGPSVDPNGNRQPYPAVPLQRNWWAAPNVQVGRLNLGHATAGNDPTQSQFLPGYLFNITSWSTVNRSFNPCYRISFNATGDLEFIRIQSQDVDGNNSSLDWKAEVVRGIALPPTDLQNAFLQWSDIRLALYGAAHCPTRFIVETVQFKKDYFDPEVYSNSAPSSDQVQELNMHYINEFKNLVFHPLDVNTAKRSGNVKVLSRKVYEIGPDTSSSDDPSNPNILCKIFKRYNRLCKWNWQVKNNAFPNESEFPDPDIEPQDGDLDKPGWQIQNYNQLNNTVVPRARIYLYVRAEAMRPVDFNISMNTADVKNHCPSMDLCIRNKWMYDS